MMGEYRYWRQHGKVTKYEENGRITNQIYDQGYSQAKFFVTVDSEEDTWYRDGMLNVPAMMSAI